MKTKQEQIKDKSSKPIEIGDTVQIHIPYQKMVQTQEGRGKNKKFIETVENTSFQTEGTVRDISQQSINTVMYIEVGSISIPRELSYSSEIKETYEGGVKFITINSLFVHPTFKECGANPFKKERFRVTFYNQNIENLLFKAKYGRRNDNFNTLKYKPIEDNGNIRDKSFVGCTVGGINFNPYVLDTNGDKQFYQRDLVWTTKQKQLLIDSIYNGIEIGKFLFRYKSWNNIEQQMSETGHGFNFDCVDGKQRFYAILEFVQNKYPDNYGNFWNDLSPLSQNKFLSYDNLSYGEMGEQATDSDVIDTFLTLNFTGTPMSEEHIKFVQSFNM